MWAKSESSRTTWAAWAAASLPEAMATLQSAVRGGAGRGSQPIYGLRAGDARAEAAPGAGPTEISQQEPGEPDGEHADQRYLGGLQGIGDGKHGGEQGQQEREVCLAFSGLFLGKLFAISAMSEICILLMVVFGFAAESLFRYLSMAQMPASGQGPSGGFRRLSAGRALCGSGQAAQPADSLFRYLSMAVEWTAGQGLGKRFRRALSALLLKS